MNAYQEKRQAKIDRYNELSTKAGTASTDRYEAAKGISSMIPFGQPILVGHHSEGRHRRDIQKIDNNMRKSVELQDKAEYYSDKAKACENNKAISSDDPEAIQKLKIKIEILESNHTEMKRINKEFKKYKGDITKINASEEMIKHIHFYVKFSRGTSPCNLSGSNAEIRRLNMRLSHLEKNANDTTTETQKNGVRLVENVEENRCQLFFDDIPSVEIRTYLKQSCFKWSRLLGCWQRHRSRHATELANDVFELMIKGGE